MENLITRPLGDIEIGRKTRGQAIQGLAKTRRGMAGADLKRYHVRSQNGWNLQIGNKTEG